MFDAADSIRFDSIPSLSHLNPTRPNTEPHCHDMTNIASRAMSVTAAVDSIRIYHRVTLAAAASSSTATAPPPSQSHDEFIARFAYGTTLQALLADADVRRVRPRRAGVKRFLTQKGGRNDGCRFIEPTQVVPNGDYYVEEQEEQHEEAVMSAGASRFPHFDSFLAALDAAPQSGIPLPFAPQYAYLPLLQPSPSRWPLHADLPPAPAAIFGDDSEGARLFIRTHYVNMWKTISERRQKYLSLATNQKGALITGNLGVGKSMFLAYVIKQLRSMQDVPAIVYQDLVFKDVYLLRPNVAHAEIYESMSAPVISALAQKKAVYLVDVGGMPMDGAALKCNAFMIVAASPQATGLARRWRKRTHYPVRLYMPCWTEEELQACRRVTHPTDEEEQHDGLQGNRLLPGVSSESVTRRVMRFGCIARTALTPDTGESELESELATALEHCDLDVVGQHAGTGLELLPESSSWVLHYVVHPDTFTLVDIVFASRPILEMVLDRLRTSQRDKILRFVDESQTSKNPVWSGARGKLFEVEAHLTLRAGGTFQVQRLVDPRSGSATAQRGAAAKGDDHRLGAPHSIHIPASPHPDPPLPLSNPAAIASLPPGQYGQLQPNKVHFPTIDGAIKPNMLFQMTVSASHHIDIDGLNAAVQALQQPQSHPIAATASAAAALPLPPPPRLFFVVPPSQFALFQPGALTSSIGTLPATISNRLEYWVLQLYSGSSPTAIGKRKTMSSSPTGSPPPSPKAAAGSYVNLPVALDQSVTCKCKGECQACSCKTAGRYCHEDCHQYKTAPLNRHKNCTNHKEAHEAQG